MELDDMLTEQEPEKTGPERKPCPECGKEVTWTQAGKPRQHKCEPKEPVNDSQPESKAPEGLVDRVITKFIEAKAELEMLEKRFKEAMKTRKELQEKRLAFLGDQLKKAGLTSQSGTNGRSEVYKVDSATVADPLIFMNWVREQEEWTFLENRVSKTAVKQRLSDGETLPPGINYAQIEKVKVVRKSR